MDLKINRVEVRQLSKGQYAFYFTLVKIDDQWCSFVSQHNCDGMNKNQAAKAFTREHFLEVEELVKQKMQHESKILN